MRNSKFELRRLYMTIISTELCLCVHEQKLYFY